MEVVNLFEHLLVNIQENIGIISNLAKIYNTGNDHSITTKEIHADMKEDIFRVSPIHIGHLT